MRQVRKGVFETNSSGTHALCFSNENNKHVRPEHECIFNVLEGLDLTDEVENDVLSRDELIRQLKAGEVYIICTECYDDANTEQPCTYFEYDRKYPNDTEDEKEEFYLGKYNLTEEQLDNLPDFTIDIISSGLFIVTVDDIKYVATYSYTSEGYHSDSYLTVISNEQYQHLIQVLK